MSEAIRLLLVEDNESDAELLRLELKRAGLELDLRRVASSRDLRHELTEGGWDIIISDYSMAGFDGVRAFRMARELRPEVPFIFVSGALGEERAAQAKQAGALDYVLKTDLERLPEVVRSARAAPPSDSLAVAPTRSPFESDVDPIGQFVHDANNLLAIVVSYGRFAQKGVDKDSQPYSDVQKVLDAAKDLEILTGQLRARFKEE